MQPSPRPSPTGTLLAAAVLAAATLAMFGDVLFAASPRVLSHPSADLASQYVHWRAFGFGELSRGNLALWNPHIDLGSPYLGGSQSALLYPPNWLHLLLPLPLAINWGLALHVFLAGCFTFLWARRRGLLPVAALLSGLLLMFGSAHFLHLYAGHLSNLCTMAWAPLLLLAIDGWFESRSRGWILLGSASVALMILAGHPQYVYYTSLAAALYSALRLARCPRRLVTAAGLLAMCALGAGLASVQLLPSLEAARESVRSGGTSLEFASSFSLPPENLLTLLNPRLFGDGADVEYWGRTYLWEVGLFAGVTGLFLAGFGTLRGERATRRFACTMFALLLLLALGSHTPLFRLLYDWLPGFDSFRGTAKFGFHASLFLALLAGIGLDRLIRAPGELRRPAAALVGLALASAAAATWIVSASRSGDPLGGWARLMQAVQSRAAALGEAYLDPARYHEPEFIRAAGAGFATGLYLAAGVASVLALLLWLRPSRPRLAYAVAALAALEVFAAARSQRPGFELPEALASAVDWAALPNDGDQRILNPLNPNLALSTGALDIWGYDPGVSRRYAEFISATQGGSPDQASQYVTFRRYPDVYRMLRLRHALLARPQGLQLVEGSDLLPRLLLVHESRVLAGRDAILQAMRAEDFDPRRTALLEQPPVPAPQPAVGAEQVALLDSSTDHLDVEARLSAPGLLLVTDGYSAGWTASALPGSEQQQYEVLPANYVLRGIPLAAGQHRLRLEYAPAAFARGRWISAAAGAVFASLACLAWRSRATRHEQAQSMPAR